MFSLRARLLLAVGTVVATGIGALGVYSSRVTRVEFQRLAHLEEENLEALGRRHKEVRSRLEDHYRRSESWRGAAGLLEALAGAGEVNSFLILIDSRGRLVDVKSPTDGDIQVELEGDHQLVLEQRTELADGRMAVDRIAYQGPSWDLKGVAGENIGRLFIVPVAEPDDQDGAFLGSVNRGLWFGVLMASGLALLATAMLSQRILEPIAELTEVARRMEGGELDHRVRVRSNDEIGLLAQAFNSMAFSLAETEQLRRNMVSDVAHELRTPLTNIRGQLEAVQDGLLEARGDVIGSLHEEVMLLSRLVDDLQELALADAGQLRFEIQRIDLGDEIRHAVEAMKAEGMKAAGEGAGILFEGSELPTVLADPRRVGQVLRNLLRNAVSHTPAGGEIVVRPRQRDGEVEVSVRNSGDGIAAEHLPYVFERFYRSDPSRQPSTGGAGLGLAIVKQLVEAQGGRVWVESQPGQGCTFFFTLPQTA